MPNAVGLFLGVLLASGTMLGGWYVAFDAGMVRSDPASSIASAAGVFAYDDEEDEVTVEVYEEEWSEPQPGDFIMEDAEVDANGNLPLREDDAADDDDDGFWWWEDEDDDPDLDDDDEVYVDGDVWNDDMWEDDGDDEFYYDEDGDDDVYVYDDDEEYVVVDEWEYENGSARTRQAVQQTNQPWYVKAFPGIGSMLQQIIPGQQAPAPRPSQPVPQRPTYPQPSCWVSAQPTLVASGGSSVVSWSSFNATRAALTGFGEVSVTGSRTIPNITSTRTLTLSVAGQGGNGSCYARITVPPPVSGPPSCIISANPDGIDRGESASLAWGSQYASSANLSGVGTVPTQGGISVSPIQTPTYTLTVGGSSGRSNKCTVLHFVE